MKSEAHRSPLVAFLRGAATSAWGKISRTKPLKEEPPVVNKPTGGVSMTIDWRPSFQALQAARNVPTARHPLAPEPSPPPMDWNIWRQMQNEHLVPGWSFCRYPVRDSSDALTFVFGMVNDGFGIHTGPFNLCDCSAPPTKVQLHAVSHMRAGFGLGLFVSRELAVQACQIASRMSDGWSTFDPISHESVVARNMVGRLHQAWGMVGIELAPFHAHVIHEEPTPAINVWVMSNGDDRPTGALS